MYGKWLTVNKKYKTSYIGYTTLRETHLNVDTLKLNNMKCLTFLIIFALKKNISVCVCDNILIAHNNSNNVDKSCLQCVSKFLRILLNYNWNLWLRTKKFWSIKFIPFQNCYCWWIISNFTYLEFNVMVLVIKRITRNSLFSKLETNKGVFFVLFAPNSKCSQYPN